jgi:hypothetical protein
MRAGLFNFLYNQVMRRGTKKHYDTHREAARQLLHARLAHYNQLYGYSYNKVFIRNTRSRWGSCSSRRNLNFNYRVALLPQALCDYIVVHELCHLEQFNHSTEFWALVSKTVPDHAERRRALRQVERAAAGPFAMLRR